MTEKPAAKKTARKAPAKNTEASPVEDRLRQSYVAALVERWQKKVVQAPDPATRRRALMALGGARMLQVLAHNPDVQAAADRLDEWGEPAPKD